MVVSGQANGVANGDRSQGKMLATLVMLKHQNKACFDDQKHTYNATNVYSSWVS
jgi:hypothetical protein